jgi:hypothetical protein
LDSGLSVGKHTDDNDELNDKIEHVRVDKRLDISMHTIDNPHDIGQQKE